MRDARLHLRHVCDLLRSLDPADAYNGVNGSSLSYLTFYTRGDKGNILLWRLLTSHSFWAFLSLNIFIVSDGDNVGKRRVSEKESVDHRPPEFLLPGCKERPLLPLQPVRDDWKVRDEPTTANMTLLNILHLVQRNLFSEFIVKWSVLTAFTVPAGSDHEQLESSSREQEDARRLNVPQRPDHGGPRAQHYVLYAWFLPQPVSVTLSLLSA